MTSAEHPKKLIEVALPLGEINAACKADKDRKTGTIRNLHKWFAPMPLPAWRALLFAALIDDPGDDEKRAYILDVIKRLVASGADLPEQDTLDEAQRILKRQFPDGVPTVMDPFCGGGSTLVEAQRLGLPAFGSDLNPVPVLIARTLTDLLPKVYAQQPIHPEAEDAPKRNARKAPAREADGLFARSGGGKTYGGYDGLIRDVVYYAEQISEMAWGELGPYYPSQPGETPLAWLWARTVLCPNPTCRVETVLTTSWWLSRKNGALAWIQPRVEGGVVHLDVVSGQSSGAAPESPKVGRGSSFVCLGCGSVVDEAIVIKQGMRHDMGLRMTCVVVERNGQRTYRRPTAQDTSICEVIPNVDDFPEIFLPDNPRWFSGPRFGFATQASLYTPRQLRTLATFADLVAGIHSQVLHDGGTSERADAIATLLGLGVGNLAMAGSSQSRWRQRETAHAKAEPAFGRNDIPMMWDFAETFFRGHSVGDWMGVVTSALRAVAYASTGNGTVVRSDARSTYHEGPTLVATDPPYFDAIGYADLSDYFYVWHRRALRRVHPDLYATVAAPKAGELTAVPSHHGNSKDAAKTYFIEGFTETFKNLQLSLTEHLPMLVVYASKEQKAGSGEETRWSSILTAMVQADLEITGAWPIHGTGSTRMIGQGTNAVATYVVMVTRRRPDTAGTCSLADFNRALRRELKPAVHALQAAGILPVDLAQAAMGPGMQIYSRYREVVDQSGGRVPVEAALRLINAALGEVLDEQEGELDPDSRFAVTWWDKHGWEPAPFGEADQLARPQGLSVDDLIRAGVATYPKPGSVGLVGAGEMDRAWNPSTDSRPTAWEAVHHLADRLVDGGGELQAGDLMRELGTLRDPAQGLVYRLYDIAARKGRTKDQERYNALIGSWAGLLVVAAQTREGGLF